MGNRSGNLNAADVKYYLFKQGNYIWAHLSALNVKEVCAFLRVKNEDFRDAEETINSQFFIV
jgi:phosphomevalonate kinase